MEAAPSSWEALPSVFEDGFRLAFCVWQSRMLTGPHPHPRGDEEAGMAVAGGGSGEGPEGALSLLAPYGVALYELELQEGEAAT